MHLSRLSNQIRPLMRFFILSSIIMKMKQRKRWKYNVTHFAKVFFFCYFYRIRFKRMKMNVSTEALNRYNNVHDTFSCSLNKYVWRLWFFTSHISTLFNIIIPKYQIWYHTSTHFNIFLLRFSQSDTTLIVHTLKRKP